MMDYTRPTTDVSKIDQLLSKYESKLSEATKLTRKLEQAVQDFEKLMKEQKKAESGISGFFNKILGRDPSQTYRQRITECLVKIDAIVSEVAQMSNEIKQIEQDLSKLERQIARDIERIRRIVSTNQNQLPEQFSSDTFVAMLGLLVGKLKTIQGIKQLAGKVKTNLFYTTLSVEYHIKSAMLIKVATTTMNDILTKIENLMLVQESLTQSIKDDVHKIIDKLESFDSDFIDVFKNIHSDYDEIAKTIQEHIGKHKTPEYHGYPDTPYNDEDDNDEGGQERPTIRPIT